jgi:hypothetical protein
MADCAESLPAFLLPSRIEMLINVMVTDIEAARRPDEKADVDREALLAMNYTVEKRLHDQL